MWREYISPTVLILALAGTIVGVVASNSNKSRYFEVSSVVSRDATSCIEPLSSNEANGRLRRNGDGDGDGDRDDVSAHALISSLRWGRPPLLWQQVLRSEFGDPTIFVYGHILPQPNTRFVSPSRCCVASQLNAEKLIDLAVIPITIGERSPSGLGTGYCLRRKSPLPNPDAFPAGNSRPSSGQWKDSGLARRRQISGVEIKSAGFKLPLLIASHSTGPILSAEWGRFNQEYLEDHGR
ncbi:hypothetical protein DHEL01_v210524 [Diaporthe helianthi]|uniref:Uncharacterized protein n=1 Tax=Diaporthe helianthi TaxID=158607 RepID=A0A2P5HLD6_DIAHE|nr:hypothetical protein DHEL01_v210524 [Diaporthe helianthi]